jgi:lipase chaperone LimK
MKRWSKGRIWTGGMLLLLLLILFSRSLQKTPAATDQVHTPPPVLEDAADWALQANEPTRTPAPTPAAEAPAPHPSLAGTDVNGGIRVDENGRIVLHRDVRRLFDYYLSLRGRMDPDSIRALLRQHLEASQPRSVVEEALTLFDRYVSLIDAEGKYAEEWTRKDLKVGEQVAAVLDERRNLRREYLGDALTEAFYQEQEQYEAYQLERLKIGTNPNLSAAEKKEALEAAEFHLSPQQREIRKQTFAWLDIKQLARRPVESLDVDSAEAIRQRFGDNALDRLAAVEQERKSWEEKREAWLAEKARISTRTELSDEERRSLLLEYGRSQLDESELRRMQALDSDEVAP